MRPLISLLGRRNEEKEMPSRRLTRTCVGGGKHNHAYTRSHRGLSGEGVRGCDDGSKKTRVCGARCVKYAGSRARVHRKVVDKRMRLSADGDHENHLTDIVVVRHDHSVGRVLLQLVRGNQWRVGEMLRRADSAYDGVV